MNAFAIVLILAWMAKQSIEGILQAMWRI